MLIDLAGWEQRPSRFTTMAYEWCSVMLENHSSLADGRRQALFLSLQIGFRHLDSEDPQMTTELAHTEHHQHMVDVVFKSGDEEVIADLLHAWTSHSDFHQPFPSLGMCAGHIVGLQPSSRRLQRLVIRSVELIGPRGFDEIGVTEFCRLLDRLRVDVEDMDREDRWANLLTYIIRRPEGVRCLSHPYWELLIGLSLSGSLQPEAVIWNPDITANLEGDQEWDKLECWVGVVWMLWPPETSTTTEAELGRVSLSLFRRRPGSVWKLGRRLVERWSKESPEGVPKSFRRICDQARRELHSGLDSKFPLIVASMSQAYVGLCFIVEPLQPPTKKLKPPHIRRHYHSHRHLGRTLSKRRYLYAF